MGDATIWCHGRVPDTSLGDRVNFGIYGIHLVDLSAQHEGGYRRGTEHGNDGRDEPYLRVSASAFDETGIYARFRDENDL